MKGFLIAALCILCVAYVTSERCSHENFKTACVVTKCGNNTLVCEHDLCTCQIAPKACRLREDCSQFNCHEKDEYHCVDGTCKCTH